MDRTQRSTLDDLEALLVDDEIAENHHQGNNAFRDESAPMFSVGQTIMAKSDRDGKWYPAEG